METNYQDIINQIKNLWRETIKEKPVSWYKISISYVIQASNFLINVIDILINHMRSLDISGQEKKTNVLLITAEIFDFVASTTIPIIYKPSMLLIKTIMIKCIFPTIIDFIVKKYNNGLWSNKNEETKKELFV